MHYAKPLAKLVGALEKLPGIGPKSAQRMAFHILRASDEEARGSRRGDQRGQGEDNPVQGMLQLHRPGDVRYLRER